MEILRLLFLPLEFVREWFWLSVVILVGAVVGTCVSLLVQRMRGDR